MSRIYQNYFYVNFVKVDTIEANSAERIFVVRFRRLRCSLGKLESANQANASVCLFQMSPLRYIGGDLEIR